jgi:hypothetical protein
VIRQHAILVAHPCLPSNRHPFLKVISTDLRLCRLDRVHAFRHSRCAPVNRRRTLTPQLKNRAESSEICSMATPLSARATSAGPKMEPETTPRKIPSAVVIPGIRLLIGPWSHRLDWPGSTQHRHTCCHDKTEYNRELEFSQNLRHLFKKCRVLCLFACRALRYVDAEHMGTRWLG